MTASVTESPLLFRCGADVLLGILHRSPDPTPRVGVVIVVGGPQYRVGSHRQFVLLARGLANAGIPVLRFDYRGMGDSEGAPRTFENVDEDIAAAIDAFVSDTKVSGVVLWGLCDAASAILMYCHRDARVRGIVLANPWVRTDANEAQAFLRHYYLQRIFERAFWKKLFSGSFNPVKSLADLITKVRVANKTPEASRAVQQSFIDRMRGGLAAFSRPALFLISERDLTAKAFTDLCTIDHVWRKAIEGAHVTSKALPNADHTFSERESLDAATSITIDWLRATQR